jgi:transcription elongation GreA/GreB family factor
MKVERLKAERHMLQNREQELLAALSAGEPLAESVKLRRPTTSDRIRGGATVNLEYQDGTRQTVWLGPDGLADDEETVVTPDSPLGRALLGRRVGDSVEYAAPAGRERVRALDVRPEDRALGHRSGNPSITLGHGVLLYGPDQRTGWGVDVPDSNGTSWRLARCTSGSTRCRGARSSPGGTGMNRRATGVPGTRRWQTGHNGAPSMVYENGVGTPFAEKDSQVSPSASTYSMTS